MVIREYLTMDLICIFLITSDIKSPFICVLAICGFFSQWIAFPIFAPLFACHFVLVKFLMVFIVYKHYSQIYFPLWKDFAFLYFIKKISPC